MTDYISRDDVLRKFIEGDGNDEFTEGYNFAVNEYREKIKAMSATDVQLVKRGKWLHDRRTQWKCSECGNFLDFDGLNCGRGSAFYCPNCGARMDGEQNE